MVDEVAEGPHIAPKETEVRHDPQAELAKFLEIATSTTPEFAVLDDHAALYSADVQFPSKDLSEAERATDLSAAKTVIRLARRDPDYESALKRFKGAVAPLWRVYATQDIDAGSVSKEDGEAILEGRNVDSRSRRRLEKGVNDRLGPKLSEYREAIYASQPLSSVSRVEGPAAPAAPPSA